MADEKELTEIIQKTAKEAARIAAQTASDIMIARIDERVKHILTVDLSEIKKHLETLNGHIADNTQRSISNKAQIRNLWMIIIAHLALLGTILGLIIYYQG